MAKTAIIKLSLIEESNEVSNEQIEKEILSHLRDYPFKMPWQKEAITVKVLR